MCPCSLDQKEHVNYCYGVFKVRAGRSPAVPRNHPQAGGLSKLNSVRHLTAPATSRSTYSRRARASDGLAAEATMPSTSRTPAGVRAPAFHRKEVIQPHLPVRLPCYDFTPIIDPTFDGCLLAVSSPASGIADFRGVTGGVYKPRERIHRDVADPRLLATPPS